jgi:hypothetical protein
MERSNHETEDDEVEVEAEAAGAAKLPQSVAITQARSEPSGTQQLGNRRRKKQGVDLHDALYRHNDEGRP